VAYFGSESLNSKAADWHTTMGVNVMGSAFMVQAALEVTFIFTVCKEYRREIPDRSPLYFLI
jgi:hypothetical protein